MKLTLVRKPLGKIKRKIKDLSYYGTGRVCPVCSKESKRFQPFGVVTREEARCVHCGALERHRLLWLYINSQTDLFQTAGKKMLHVAPEPCLEPKFENTLQENYITSDIDGSRAKVQMDIMDIGYPDESFDVIYCSHVLEHVTDDRKAMREFYRVLKKDGWAILLVPIMADKSFEDPSITDPDERLRVYGNSDHVRIYGPDYIDRLREAGFNVSVLDANNLCSPEEILKMGLTDAAGEIYFCTK